MAGAAALGGLATAAVLLLWGPDVAYRNGALVAALRMLEASIGFLGAFLLFGRVQRRRRLDDLLLASGLLFLAASTLLFAVVPAIFFEQGSPWASWTTALGRFAGWTLLAAAALAPARLTGWTRRRIQTLVVGYVFAFIWIAAAVRAVRKALPPVSDDPERPFDALSLAGDTAVNGLWVLSLLLAVVAALGFARKALRVEDRFVAAFAVACVFALVGRLDTLLFQTPPTEWVSLGDAFRLLFYLTILGAIVIEIEASARRAVLAGALEERRRIARDLHDGLAQDLTSAQRNLRWLDEHDELVRRASVSLERAVEGARQAIAALGDVRERPLSEQLADLAHRLRDREGVPIELEVTAAARVPRPVSEALLLIASEAVTNAARHGAAENVTIGVYDGPRLRMEVRDDGVGFEPAEVRVAGVRGYGLLGMRERAELIGGRLRVFSHPGQGTRVEVVL